jgi:Rrf2 family protein
MQISARVDYGVRALLVLTEHFYRDSKSVLKIELIAREQEIPMKFLESILIALKHSDIVTSVRGKEGGYRLSQLPSDVSIADVMRSLEGPLAAVRSERPESTEYEGVAEHLKDVWVATRAALRHVLEAISLEDVYRGKLPKHVETLLADKDAWVRR